MGALIVVDPDERLAKHLGDSMQAHCALTWTQEKDVAGAASAEDADVRVILIGPGVPQAEAFEFAQNVCRERPDISTVLVRYEVDTELLRTALRIGLADVVAVPNGQLAEVQVAVEAALERAIRLHGEADTDERPHRATTLTVLSTKGGVGKSVVACNLAVALSKLGNSVALVDLDLRSGDVGIMLQLKPERTIADAAIESDHLDAEMLRGFLAEHSSGASVLLAPANPDDANVVTSPRLNRILDLLGEMFEYLVFDTPPILDDCVLTAIDKSDLIYVVATMDVASVKDTRLALQRLSALGYSNNSVRLLLNRADSNVWLAVADVERAVGLDISARIPSDRLVPRSVNKGVPVVMEAPKSAVARSLNDIAKSILAEGGAS
jgi:pilus assembly protein CpaE